MSGNYCIGLDLGTTSAKAVIFQFNGKVKSEAERLITTYYPESGWVEQDPNEIESFAVKAIKDAMDEAKIQKDEVKVIGISCAMHSLICVDQDGNPLSNALIWSDGRSSQQAESFSEKERQDLFLKTGVPIHPMTPFTKLVWMKETAFEPYKRARYFMSVKEFILFRWFGERVVDYSMASATGLFTPSKLEWDETAIEITQIEENQLSEVVPPTYVLNGLDKKVADGMGLLSDIPVVIGAADGQLANLGIGAILPGEVAITVGTSGAVRQFSKGVRINEKRETFSYAFTDEYSIIGGPSNNGGIALQWLKELLNNQDSYSEFIEKAGKVTAGAEGLIFHPYINGERAPIWNQRATGNFSGLSITHKQEHFIRAVLEGITFNLYQIERALCRLAGEPSRIYVNGGLARSNLWLQMLADIFGKEVYVAETHHSSAWGAAWTSLVAIGEVNSFEEIKNNIQLGEPIVPNEKTHRAYQEIYEEYMKRSRI
ncbi:gluconokinase [Lederbergia wuyishanensis]|uniref:Gluconokinase n=1 Tax=Lederbergia wuyishanensis TaxID=1347903 RepID=A0ABU0D3Y7_9BACI|nr:gluconokinase [Lederbergia wuyishanensis]MCJ8007738.1 gluconokinase [Lederbergia wuyishanensis]MDQ0343099.1 gluconokinase [Lederbergia wuyishanensis]